MVKEICVHRNFALCWNIRIFTIDLHAFFNFRLMKGFITAGIFLFSAFYHFSQAQDIHFSQYNLTPLAINPAQAGAYKTIEVIANYKSQWTSISPNAYK